ncbi:MAG: Gfo/Idh/MocA family protein, partial [Planctomycetota bacterium]
MFTDYSYQKPRLKKSISRRTFIKTAAATSLTIIKPALAASTKANSRINVGVIGLGGRGAWIADLIQQHGGYQLTALADYFPHVVDKAGDRFNVPKEKRFSGLGGYKKLIATKPDAVFLETPPYCFPDHVEAAVEANCHVYIAKPLACDVAGSL